ADAPGDRRDPAAAQGDLVECRSFGSIPHRTLPRTRSRMKSGGVYMQEPFGLKDYSQGEAVVSKDPVCGPPIDEDEAVAKTECAGQTYYFCSTECQERFEQDPALFLGGPIT